MSTSPVEAEPTKAPGVELLEKELHATRVNSTRALRELHGLLVSQLAAAEARAARATRREARVRRRLRQMRQRALRAEGELEQLRRAPVSRAHQALSALRGRVQRVARPGRR